MTTAELKEEYRGLDDFFLAREPDGTVWLWGTGEYEDSSVLAGQYRQARLVAFDSMKEAQAAYPDAEIQGPRPPVEISMPDCPPDWSDPMDAGETW